MNLSDKTYKKWLEEIKQKIKTAQLKAAVSANSSLIDLYWDSDKEIIEKQKESSWGDSVLEQLSLDLKLSFPDIKGFSRRNLYAIRQWYLFYSQKFEIVPQAVAQIPWGHNRLVLQSNTGKWLVPTQSLPENFKSQLPTVEQLENQLSRGNDG